jgi:chemotaxis protein CheD
MQEIIIDVSDIGFSSNVDEVLCAPSLGSCIALSIYDPEVQAGGILIYMLPDSTEMELDGLDQFVFMFADTGLPNFLEKAMEFGISCNRAKLVVAGGGHMPGQKGKSDIGSRNNEALEAFLSKNGLIPHHRSIGGKINRTLKLEIGSGRIRIQIAGQSMEEI